MDQRIIEKIKKIEQDRVSERNHEKERLLEQEKAHELYVSKKLPEARKWVEERLLDIIVVESARETSLYKVGQLSELNLEYCDSQENGNRDIPVEAKALAAREVEGLSIRGEWVPRSQNPNDESGRTWDDAYTTYYVSWK